MYRTKFRPLVEPLEHRCLLALTDVDASFGNNGRALVDHVSQSTDYMDAVSLTPDGKLLIAGTSDVLADAKPTLARYNLDGTPDTTFGTNGKMRLTSGTGFVDMLVNADGTVTTLGPASTGVPYMRRFTASGALDSTFNFTVTGLSGTAMDLDRTAAGDKFSAVIGSNLVRVSANGSADSTFGSSGRVTFTQEANFIVFNPQRVAAQPDGSILVAGRYGNAGQGERRVALRRFTSAGVLDTTFGTSGTFVIPGFSTDTWTDKLMLQSDGKLLLVFRDRFSSSTVQSHIARLNVGGGSLDTTFHGDGIATVNPSTTYTETIGDVIRDASGRLYGVGLVQGGAVGNSPSYLFRMLANGNVDTTFATGGYNQTYFPSNQVDWGDPRLVLPGNGSLYYATSNHPGTSGVNQDQLLYRFNESSGALDASFGSGGRVVIPFTASQSHVTLGSALLSDGGVAFAGYPPGVSGKQMGVGKVTAAGQPASFGVNGAVEINFGTTESLAMDVLELPGGDLIVGGRTSQLVGSSWVDNYALARLNPDGSLDGGFGSGGKLVLNYADFEQINRLELAPDGTILALGIHQILGTAGERRSSLFRFFDDGTLDDSFGDGGRLLLGTDDWFGEIIPLADGSILLGGTRENSSAAPFDDGLIVRLNYDGTPDETFGAGGEIRFDVGNDHNAVDALALDATGRIYAADWDNSTFNGTIHLRRYSASGGLDTTYGTGGFVTHELPSNTGAFTDMKVTASGKLLVLGETKNSPRDVYLLQFLASGDYDTAFGTAGRQQYDLGGADGATELHVGSNGRWTITGDGDGPGTLSDFAALRLMGTDQPPDTIGPSATGAFKYARGHVIELNFNENVNPPTAGQLTLTRLSTGGTPVAIPQSWLSYSSEAQRLSIRPDAPLADGNYRLTLPAGAYSDTSNNPSTTALTLDFFALAGDANGDRRVNTTDRSTLDFNFGQSNRTAQQGDFNFDGAVNEADRAILDANFNLWLPAQGTIPALPVESFSANFRFRRESPALLAAWDNVAGTGAPKHRIVVGAINGLSLTSFGNDNVVVDFSNGPLLDAGRFDYTGTQGTDALNVVGSSAADVVTIDGTDVTVNGFVVRRNTVETVTFDGAGGWDAVSVSGAQPVAMPATQFLESLNVAGGATVTMPPGANLTLVTRGLSIATNGKLNLADNDLLWDYTGASTYDTAYGYAATARSTGTGGIVSTAAADSVLAIVDNAGFGRTIWNGIPIDATTVIGKYTYYGDGNLDGRVTGDDYLTVDANLGFTGAQWFQGDFNFDGKTTGDDYLAIDAHLGKGTINPASFDEQQAEMIAIHAELYGGKDYVKQAERAAKGPAGSGRRSSR